MKEKSSIAKILPVMFGFFIMGFVDVVGIATNYVKSDFQLSDTLANILPVMVFAWFLVFSVPTGLLMNKIGRKNTVLLSMAITFLAMLVPLISYNFTVILVAFAFLGIGNTIIQVALNPLLTNVVSGEKLASSLTLGQFVKAIAAFLGPIIAGFAAGSLGNWKLIFPLYAGITLISTLWLWMTSIDKEEQEEKNVSVIGCFSLLKDKYILAFFIGILLVVGIDVGLNVTIPKYLMERCSIPLDQAALGISLYFVARTVGTFLGAIILAKYAPGKIFIYSVILGILGFVGMLVVSNLVLLSIFIFIVGFACANLFSIIFSYALKRQPERANEVSGLMIMGVSGGAIALFLGVVSDAVGSQIGGVIVLLVCLLYFLYLGNLFAKSDKK
jgi:Fucose permease